MEVTKFSFVQYFSSPPSMEREAAKL